jgi:hypothetical protein
LNDYLLIVGWNSGKKHYDVWCKKVCHEAGVFSVSGVAAEKLASTNLVNDVSKLVTFKATDYPNFDADVKALSDKPSQPPPDMTQPSTLTTRTTRNSVRTKEKSNAIELTDSDSEDRQENDGEFKPDYGKEEERRREEEKAREKKEKRE